MRNLNLFCLATGILLLSANAGWADCQSDYNRAIGLLNSAKQKALNNEHIDQTAFQAEFKPVMDSMVAGQCMNEAMSLMKYVQEEQKQYPAPAGAPKPPVLTGKR